MIKSLTAVMLITGMVTFISESASGETLIKPCPFSCSSLGQESEATCEDWRVGNDCFVRIAKSKAVTVANRRARQDSDRSNSTQFVCVSSNGTLRTRTKCRSGETRLTGQRLGISGIPAGATITGVTGGTFTTGGAGAWSALTSFPTQLSTSLTPGDIVIAASSELLSTCTAASNCLAPEQVGAASTCTGTTSKPTAPAGKLCIYPVGVTNATGISASPIPASGTTAGFEVTWAATGAGPTSFIAIWAYTAPTVSVSGTPTTQATRTASPAATRTTTTQASRTATAPSRTSTPGTSGTSSPAPTQTTAPTISRTATPIVSATATSSPAATSTARPSATSTTAASPTAGTCIDASGNSSGCFGLPAGATGNVNRGATLYASACSDCHSSMGPRTYSQFVSSLNIPAMRSLSSLTQQERADIVVYLNRNNR